MAREDKPKLCRNEESLTGIIFGLPGTPASDSNALVIVGLSRERRIDEVREGIDGEFGIRFELIWAAMLDDGLGDTC